MEDKNKISLLQELQSDRKYASIVDEYKRIYQDGHISDFEFADKELFFTTAMQIFLKDLDIDIDISKIYNDYEFMIGKKKAKIYEYIPNSILTVKYVDNENNENRTSIRILEPFFKKNKNSNKIKFEYVEWYKGNKTFWGLGDSLRRKLIKKRLIYRAAMITEELTKKLALPPQPWAKKYIDKVNEKGKISIV